MKDARTLLREWFRSGKRRRLSLQEARVLDNCPDYLRLYNEEARRADREQQQSVQNSAQRHRDDN